MSEIQTKLRFPKFCLHFYHAKELSATARQNKYASSGKQETDRVAKREKIDAQRDAIIAMHQHIMNKVSSSIDFDEYNERFIVHSLLERPNQNLDLNLLAEELQLGAQRVEGLFENVNKRIMKRIAQRSGSIIATSDNHNLPWWTLLEAESKSESRSNR